MDAASKAWADWHAARTHSHTHSNTHSESPTHTRAHTHTRGSQSQSEEHKSSGASRAGSNGKPSAAAEEPQRASRREATKRLLSRIEAHLGHTHTRARTHAHTDTPTLEEADTGTGTPKGAAAPAAASPRRKIDGSRTDARSVPGSAAVTATATATGAAMTTAAATATAMTTAAATATAMTTAAATATAMTTAAVTATAMTTAAATATAMITAAVTATAMTTAAVTATAMTTAAATATAMNTAAATATAQSPASAPAPARASATAASAAAASRTTAHPRAGGGSKAAAGTRPPTNGAAGGLPQFTISGEPGKSRRKRGVPRAQARGTVRPGIPSTPESVAPYDLENEFAADAEPASDIPLLLQPATTIAVVLSHEIECAAHGCDSDAAWEGLWATVLQEGIRGRACTEECLRTASAALQVKTDLSRYAGGAAAVAQAWNDSIARFASHAALSANDAHGEEGTDAETSAIASAARCCGAWRDQGAELTLLLPASVVCAHVVFALRRGRQVCGCRAPVDEYLDACHNVLRVLRQLIRAATHRVRSTPAGKDAAEGPGPVEDPSSTAAAGAAPAPSMGVRILRRDAPAPPKPLPTDAIRASVLASDAAYRHLRSALLDSLDVLVSIAYVLTKAIESFVCLQSASCGSCVSAIVSMLVVAAECFDLADRADGLAKVAARRMLRPPSSGDGGNALWRSRPAATVPFAVAVAAQPDRAIQALSDVRRASSLMSSDFALLALITQIAAAHARQSADDGSSAALQRAFNTHMCSAFPGNDTKNYRVSVRPGPGRHGLLGYARAAGSEIAPEAPFPPGDASSLGHADASTTLTSPWKCLRVSYIGALFSGTSECSASVLSSYAIFRQAGYVSANVIRILSEGCGAKPEVSLAASALLMSLAQFPAQLRTFVQHEFAVATAGSDLDSWHRAATALGCMHLLLSSLRNTISVLATAPEDRVSPLGKLAGRLLESHLICVLELVVVHTNLSAVASPSPALDAVLPDAARMATLRFSETAIFAALRWQQHSLRGEDVRAAHRTLGDDLARKTVLEALNAMAGVCSKEATCSGEAAELSTVADNTAAPLLELAAQLDAATRFAADDGAAAHEGAALASFSWPHTASTALASTAAASAPLSEGLVDSAFVNLHDILTRVERDMAADAASPAAVNDEESRGAPSILGAADDGDGELVSAILRLAGMEEDE